ARSLAGASVPAPPSVFHATARMMSVSAPPPKIIAMVHLLPDGMEEVDEVAVGIAEEQRAVAPRLVRRLEPQTPHERLRPGPHPRVRAAIRPGSASPWSTRKSTIVERFAAGVAAPGLRASIFRCEVNASTPPGVRSSAYSPGSSRVTARPVTAS